MPLSGLELGDVLDRIGDIFSPFRMIWDSLGCFDRTIPLESLLHDVSYARRGFRCNPVFTLTPIATLALGIGATTAVFSVVDRILFRSLPYAQADRLVSVGMVHSLETQEFLMGNFYCDWRDNHKPFEEMTSEQTSADECDLTEQNPARLSCEAVEVISFPLLAYLLLWAVISFQKKLALAARR